MKFFLLLYRDRFEFAGPYDSEVVRVLKTIPPDKRRWDKAEKRWVFAVDKKSFSIISKYFMFENGKRRNLDLDVVSMAEGINGIFDYFKQAVDTTTHYTALGVEEGASRAEIKQAYRGIVIKAHPDRGGDSDAFIAVTKAYQVLKDDNKRRRYDASLKAVRRR